jgi:hypothetical protein
MAVDSVSVRFGQAVHDWEQQFDIVLRELNHIVEVIGDNAHSRSANGKSAVETASAWAGGLTDS